MKKLLFGLVLAGWGALFCAHAYDTVLLWPDDPALNDPGGMGTEVEKRGKLRMQGVDTPHMRLFPAPSSGQPTPAIIQVPGGGYNTVVTGIHTPIADWFVEQGVRPFMLVYRCPATQTEAGTLADIQRAIRMVRENAAEWNIDPNRVGVLGSSAGGHLSVRASLQFDQEPYPLNDPMDLLSPKPDFAVLLYPAYLDSGSGTADWITNPEDAPPTIFFAARDDSHFSSSLAYEGALQNAGVPVESLYFDTGGHGFSLRTPEATSTWPEACLQWLVDMNILESPSGLSALAGDGKVWLDWIDSPELDLDSYSVYRSTTPGTNYSVLATNLTSSAYVDNAVVNGTTYYYVVTETDTSTNESAASAEVLATPQVDNTPPAAPAGLSASAGDGSVALDWSDNSEGDLSSYSVYRSTTSSNYSGALATGLTSSAYVDNTAANGTTYYYVVTATDINGNESAQSVEVSAVPEEVSGIIVFGTDNDGDGGFTYTGTNGTTRTVTINASNVNFHAETGGDAAFIRQFGIDRTPDTGVKYTVSGTMRINDAYADDNNRIDLLLFTDPAKALRRDNSGQIGIVWNTDDGSAGGSPGGNRRDGLGILNGYNNVDADASVPYVLRNQTIPYAQDILQGGQITMTATFWFTGTSINIDASMTDAGGVTQIGTAVVAAADFTGDYFGFANTSTVRNYDGDPDPTGQSRDNPTDIDYLSFSVESTGGEPQLTDFEQWLEDNGLAADAGATTDSDGDGLNNLYEYAFAGNPTNGLAPTNLPVFTKVGNEFIYVHPKRSDNTNLTYTVLTTTNLLDAGAWTNQGYTVTGTNVTGGALNFVTNDVDTVREEAFIRLKVEQ